MKNYSDINQDKFLDMMLDLTPREIDSLNDYNPDGGNWSN